jgi:hypothetical protein
VDIVLVKRQGRFSGEAFVVLPGMMQVEFALNKHKAYMGKRYVEVQPASKEVALPHSRPPFRPLLYLSRASSAADHTSPTYVQKKCA